MCNGSKSDFLAYYRLTTPINIMGDDTCVRVVLVTHYGTILVKNLQIDALHGYSQIFLSIGELNDQGNIAIFGNDRCIIRDYTTMLITGTKNGKLFQVDRAADTHPDMLY